MTISIYGSNNYDRSGKIRWLLEELGLPYDNRWLDPANKDLDEGPYLTVNPLGRIPAVVINDRPMIESGAIVAYLADLHIDKGLAPSLASETRLDYQQWMYFAAATVDPFASRISIIEDIPAGDVLDKKTDAYLTEVREALGFLNQTLSKREYLTGTFSAADICVGYHLYFASLWPEVKGILDDQPHVLAFLERLKKRPAALKAKVFSFEA
jgi:glutathione S-transferase